MPRSADKRKGRSSVQEQEVEYIIPGGLTQAQWTDMLIQEAADEAVGEIMEELLSKVMDRCYKVYFEKELVHYSTSWAKNYLTQILAQQNIRRDEGEEPEVASKTEDSEPLPTIEDSLTGCVPIVNAAPRPSSQQETDIGHIPVPTEPRVNQQINVMSQTNSSPKQSEEETSPRRPVSYESKYSSKAPSLHRPQKTDLKKKQQVNSRPKVVPSKLQVNSRPKVVPSKLQVNSRPKVVPSKLQPPLSCSAEKKDVDIKGKNGARCVHNHKTGSVRRHRIPQPLQKLDPSSLPQHFIIPQLEIVDNSCIKPKAKSKLQQRGTKQPTERAGTSLKQLSSSNNQPTRFQRRNEADVCLQKSSPSRNRKEESVVLAKGISLLDPQAVEMNPPICNTPPQSPKLMSIKRHSTVPPTSVDQVIAGPPRVIPLFQSKNSDN